MASIRKRTKTTQNENESEKKHTRKRLFQFPLPQSWDEVEELEKDPEYQAAKKEFDREMKERFRRKK